MHCQMLHLKMAALGALLQVVFQNFKYMLLAVC